MATFSISPLSVIWCSPKLENGTALGQKRQAANPPAASTTIARPTQTSARERRGAPTGCVPTAALFATPLAAAQTATEPEEPGDEVEPTRPTLPGVACGEAATRPEPLLLCNLLRSARNSAADWQRRSRSFSSVLFRIPSNSGGSAGFSSSGAVGA